jgi:putative protease
MSPLPELVCPAGTPAAARRGRCRCRHRVLGSVTAPTRATIRASTSTPTSCVRASPMRTRGCHVLVAINTFPPAGNPGPWQRVDSGRGRGRGSLPISVCSTTQRAITRRAPVQASAANTPSTPSSGTTSTSGVCTAARARSRKWPRSWPPPASRPGVRLRQRRPDVRGPLFPLLVPHRPLPDERGRLRAGEPCRTSSRKAALSVSAPRHSTASRAAKKAAYPTPCKAARAHGRASYLFEEPVGLNAIAILPELKAAGVTALKIEGRQPPAYVSQVVGDFRQALDALARPAPPASGLKARNRGRTRTFGATGAGDERAGTARLNSGRCCSTGRRASGATSICASPMRRRSTPSTSARWCARNARRVRGGAR